MSALVGHAKRDKKQPSNPLGVVSRLEELTKVIQQQLHYVSLLCCPVAPLKQGTVRLDTHEVAVQAEGGDLAVCQALAATLHIGVHAAQAGGTQRVLPGAAGSDSIWGHPLGSPSIEVHLHAGWKN